MRTGIFVYEPMTLTIQGSEPLTITSMDGQINKPVPATGHVEVPAGIYKVLSASAVTVVNAENMKWVATTNDKDPFPDLTDVVMQSVTVPAYQVQTFFSVPDAKQLTL